MPALVHVQVAALYISVGMHVTFKSAYFFTFQSMILINW
jgi:hypothetical protein